MKLEQLEQIVLKISNQLHCRYWKHWNYPVEQPRLMAINFRHFSEKTYSQNLAKELRSLGFQEKVCDEEVFWIVERD
jgi:hypothetical protein